MGHLFKTDEKADAIYRPGVRKDADGIHFTFVCPSDKQASLLLYQKEDGKIAEEIPFSGESGIKSIKVLNLDWRQFRYNFCVDGDVIQDPYAKCVYKNPEDGTVQCEFYFEKFLWGKSQRPRIPYDQGIMYHLHVRNYTMHEKSGVTHKGTFLGLKEKISYLKKLGVNQLILMPVYEFEEEEEGIPAKKTAPVKMIQKQKNYWGYKKGFYFAPKKNYAATKDPVKEFKTVVKALHENQIEVIPEFFFTADIPLRDQMEVCRYWMDEFRIDGFRIMGDTDLARHLAGDPLFADVKIISYYVGDLQQEKKKYGNLAEMNDGFMIDMRKILKGDEGVLEQMAYRTQRNPSDYAVINYMTGHDGFTLYDLVSYNKKHNEENGENNLDGSDWNYSWNCGAEGESRKRDILALRLRQRKNAMMLLLLSQGTPMILAGDEFGNSQNGNNNPYCLDNPVSWTDWGNCRKNQKFLQFVKDLIAFRKEEPMLHREKAYSFMDRQACGYPDLSYHGRKAWYGDFGCQERKLGMLYFCREEGKEKFLYVMYNLNSEEQELALPKLPGKIKWYKTVDTSLSETICNTGQEMESKEKMMTIPGRTIVILTGKEE